MPVNPDRNPTKRRLTKEVVPFASKDFYTGSVAMIENPDPVLQHIAMKNEAEWRTMERACPAVMIAKTKRVNTLMSYGSEVKEGSKSATAIELRDWAIAFLKYVSDFSTVLEKIEDARFWGWRPLECLYDFGFKYKGKAFWGVRHVYEKMPEDFKFTEDRELVYVGNGYQDPIVFNRPEDKYHWLVCSSGSTNNPYGEAVYRSVWFPYYVGQRFLQLWGQGMGRSVGTMKFKEGGGIPGLVNNDSQAKTMGELETELSEVMRTLNSKGVLIERAGWTVEMLADINFSQAWETALQYIDDNIRLIITGETLTSKASASGEGSRALGEVHRSGLIDYAKQDGKFIESCINDRFLHPAIRLNHGEDIPDEDMPKFRMKIGNLVDLDKAKAMFDMGAPIDGRRVAADAGVPLVLDPTADDVVLQKIQLDPNADPEGGDGEGGHQGGDNKPRRPVPVKGSPKQAPAAAKPKRDDGQLAIFPAAVQGIE